MLYTILFCKMTLLQLTHVFYFYQFSRVEIILYYYVFSENLWHYFQQIISDWIGP